MTVFKTFLKVLKSCKGTIILYSVILIFFAAFNMKSGDNTANFVAEKPDIFIINQDQKEGITENLIHYFEENANLVDLKNDEDAINDALFYREVNYIISIPEHFREDFLNHKNPTIEVKSTGDYMASLSEMMLKRYLKVANIYNNTLESEEEVIKNLDKTLSKQTEVQVTSKLDTDHLAQIASYYNFANYSILAGCVFVICMILFSFQRETIRKRTIISSIDYKKYNRKLLLSNGLFAVILWFFYVLVSFFLLGNSLFTTHTIFYLINSFIFTLCALSIAFLIGNLIHNREAINGIVNVVALGSSFLCGAFVPVEYLPDFVLKIAHVLPSYWYINTNE
ncbi:MAG: ABC transporter permease, partial [Bacilli bacterium]|nr:ABC transporter permease [Bacilli bacterium]